GVPAGSLSGPVGIGGGVVIVPALMFGLGLSQHTAQGTSLAVLSLPVVGLGALTYYRNGHVNLPVALLIAGGFVVGGLFGGRLANALPADTIRKVFAVLLLVVGVKLLFFGK
ncbi:MAG: TSUP family transporter, partial [Hymenobacteraceae bacterium]|nr:TSUP family transporter [Hymenobacteraceae bacterium]